MTKRYEKYKDSGIAWIGEIPEHWSVKRLNDIGKYRKGPFGSALKVDSFIDKSDDAIKVYEQQNAIKKSAIIGASYISKEYFENNIKGIINQALMRMRMDCRYVNLSFFLYIFDILLRVESEQSSNGSAMKNIPPFDILKKIRIPLANISEQEQIAKYLDWKCGEIDRIVEVRERQIKLLGELRTSVISRAVTRGLNPNAPLKDSGIDWIGQIPEHWEVRKISRIFSKIGSGTTPKSGNEDYYAENGENWLQTGDLNDSYINDTSKKITIKALDDHSLRFYPEGSIVMAMYGATIGKLGLLNIKTTTNQACCVMAGNKVYHSKYGFNTLLAARTHILTLAYGGGQPNISQDTIKTIQLPVPTIDEQQQIADYLDKKTAEIDSAIDKFKVQIDKLKEYRQALITEVVTGKIDVRGIEIPTPKSN